MNLNKEQQEAIEHTGSPLIIYAGPGTGKTLVLQKKYEHLIKTEVTPHEIRGITFTRAAATELKNRITETTKINPSHIVIKTFHSICLSIIEKYNASVLQNPGFTIIGTSEQKKVIRQCFKNKNLPSSEDILRNVKDAVSRMKKKQPPNGQKEFINEFAKEIYPEYAKQMRILNKIDYDDIINTASQILEDPRALYYYQTSYKHILLDEAQDTTIPQSEIIYKINCPNTTIVGDQNQSIYSFAGANPNFMKEFEEKTGGKVIHLKQNYRNPQSTIDAATTIIKNNKNFIDTDLQSTSPEAPIIHVTKTNDEENEANLIANGIKHNNIKNLSILYRRNENARAIEYALLKQKIPYEINSIHFLNRKEIKNFITAIRFIQKPTNKNDFVYLLQLQKGIGDKTTDTILNNAFHGETSFLGSALKYTQRAGVQQIIGPVCEALLEATTSTKDQQIDLILKKIIPPEKDKDRIKNVHDFITILKQDKEPIQNFLKYTKISEPDIKIMTMHASKGTENDSIFIIGVEEGLMPDENSYKNKEIIEEERRLFYVALTRSKNIVLLTHANQRVLGRYRLSQKPSRFINELPEIKRV